MAPYDPTLFRRNVRCDRETLKRGSDGEFEFVTAQWVVDGILGWACFGEEDPAMFTTWELLTTIYPAEKLGPLGVLAGFDAPDSDINATVTAIGDRDGSTFQMSMNLPLIDPTDPEFLLTVAHELGHILAGHIDQLDRLSEPSECDTYDNGDGCFLPGAISTTG